MEKLAPARVHPASAAGSFFLTGGGKPLARATVGVVFWRLRQQLSWPARPGEGRPRMHDLRHTLACRCLLRWYREGVDVEHALPALATYLGHAGVAHTYWCLTGIPEPLGLAATRFERFAAPDGGGRP